VSIFISFHSIIFESCTVGCQTLTGTKTEFNAKWPFKVISGHAFWDSCNRESLVTDIWEPDGRQQQAL